MIKEKIPVTNQQPEILTDEQLLEILCLSHNATAIYTGEEIIIRSANDAMLAFWNKDKSIIGKSLQEGVPELIGQPFIDLLKNVWNTGTTYEAKNVPAQLMVADALQTVYFDFIYRAIKNERGEMRCILHTAHNVTKEVNAIEELQQTQSRLTLAIEGAQLGLWTADLVSDELIISERAKQIHGVKSGTSLTLTESLEMIKEEYRGLVSRAIQHAVENRNRFDVEYPITPRDGSPERWLKSNGLTYYNQQGAPLFVSGTILDITERKKDEQRKNDFIAMVSHELKTPLTSLNVYIQLLQMIESNKNDKFTTEALDKATRQVSKMTSLINSFLNMSRLESGKIHIDKQRFDMAGLIREMEKETFETITTHPIIFAPVVETFVIADRDKIGQVINNFISNAVKYSRPERVIHVACITIDGTAQVSVKDEGKGIEQKDIDKLFERYYRVETEESNTISGFGIGLYVCAEIIQRHDGKIWVESEPGKGSVFYFRLPLAES